MHIKKLFVNFVSLQIAKEHQQNPTTEGGGNINSHWIKLRLWCLSNFLFIAFVSLAACSVNKATLDPVSQIERSLTPTFATETIEGELTVTTKPIMTQKPTLQATASPTSDPTVASAVTPLATATRTSYQISNTSNYMVLSSLMWHPDNIRTTAELPIQVGVQPWSPDGSQIAGWDREKKSLAILTLETRTLDILENTSAWYSFPFWSPDGEHLLYSVPSEANPNRYYIVIYNLETREEVALVNDLELINLSGWSYDSTDIAYIYWSEPSTSGEQQTILEVFNIMTLTSTQINLSSIKVEKALWSPNSKQLIAYSNRISPDSS